MISPAASTLKLITARSKNIAETPSIPSEMFHSNILLFLLYFYYIYYYFYFLFPSILSEMFHWNILLFSQTQIYVWLRCVLALIFPNFSPGEGHVAGCTNEAVPSLNWFLSTPTSCCADPDPNFRIIQHILGWHAILTLPECRRHKGRYQAVH